MSVIFYRGFTRLLALVPPSVRVFVMLGVVLLYGTLGFVQFERTGRPELGYADAAWWSIVTISTVGYGDIAPLTLAGRFLVGVPLMLSGIGLLGYVLSLVTTRLVESKNKELRGMASHLFSGHVVIANFPSLGKVMRVIDELKASGAFEDGTRILLIDEDLTELPPELAKRGVSFVKGNPARDATLARASIESADEAIILVKRPGDPHSDDHNLAVTLAIEGRTPRVRTVVECVDPESEELLKKAGADSIVCMARFESHFITTETVNPGTQEVVDDLLSHLRGDGQQIHFTKWDRADDTFGGAARRFVAEGHLAIGVRRDKQVRLNVTEAFAVNKGDDVISIGPKHIKSLS